MHRRGKNLFAKLYNSKTLNNILKTPRAAANLIDDPLLFVASALSDLDPGKFEFTEGFPILKQVPGWIVFDCTCKKGENLSIIELSPVRGGINQRSIKPVNRGFNAVIEATIHATRYVSLKEQKYLKYIEYYDTIIQKCGGVRDKDAMRLLYMLIGYQK